jgi:hypothetical protein
MDKKYNKKMQLSLYILAGWLLDGSASPATFLAVRVEPERLLEGLGSPEKVYVKGIPVPSFYSKGRREC